VKKKILLTIFLFLVLLTILSFRVLAFFKPFLPHLNFLLGSNKPTTYLILLGNDTEARANGGFAGSYAKITTNNPKLTSLRDSYPNQKPCLPAGRNPSPLDRHAPLVMTVPALSVSFHDIYVPNGQLEGYVKPPDAIQQAFGHGTWELANADYEPHFPTAASSIRWFLEKGKETNPDILGIINLSTIKKVFNIVGEIKLDDDTTITPDNLYLYLQGKAELNFFPGSTQKADALHEVGNATLNKLKSLPLTKKIKIAKEIYKDLQNQNIVLNSTNLNFQKFLESKKWAGEYIPPIEGDFFGLVELNLGANKANQYVTRQTTHVIASSPSSSLREGTPTWQSIQINHQITVDFQNTSPEANPNPPLYYGGNYISFLRFYLPVNATDIEINHTEIATSSAGFSADVLNNQLPVIASDSAAIHTNENKKFTTISFWHLTLAGQHSDIKLSYSLSSERPCHSRESGNPSDINLCPYSLTLLKQNGFQSSPQSLNIFGKTSQTSLDTPFTYPK